MFKVGDLVKRKAGQSRASIVRRVSEVFPNGWFNVEGGEATNDDAPVGGCWPQLWELHVEVDFVKIPAREKGLCWGCAHYEPGRVSTECNKVNGVLVVEEDRCTAPDSFFVWQRVMPIVPASTPTARVLDPATSKGKRATSRYAEAVVFLLGMNPNGLTGKQMAELSGFPLNCITPRFAPLRRAGLISDSGNRRDKQSVWVKVC